MVPQHGLSGLEGKGEEGGDDKKTPKHSSFKLEIEAETGSLWVGDCSVLMTGAY